PAPNSRLVAVRCASKDATALLRCSDRLHQCRHRRLARDGVSTLGRLDGLELDDRPEPRRCCWSDGRSENPPDHWPLKMPASDVIVIFVPVIRPTALAGGYQNEFPVVTHGWSEKVRGRQGERTTTPQLSNAVRRTKRPLFWSTCWRYF